MIYQHEKKQPTGPTEPYPKGTQSLVPVMTKYLEGRGLSFSCAYDNGWFPTDELDGVPRLVIPATSLSGRRYWQARAMVPVPDPLRWRSARGSKDGAVVLCWPLLVKARARVVVVEGPLDALAAASVNHIGLAAMGKSNVTDVLGYLKKAGDYKLVFHGLSVVVVPDLDAPEFAARAVTELAISGVYAEIRLPPYEDLAALTREEREELLG